MDECGKPETVAGLQCNGIGSALVGSAVMAGMRGRNGCLDWKGRQAFVSLPRLSATFRLTRRRRFLNRQLHGVRRFRTITKNAVLSSCPLHLKGQPAACSKARTAIKS